MTVDHRPLLRQHLDLTDPSLLSWPGMIAGACVLATTFMAGPELRARTIVATQTAAAQRLDNPSVLVTVLGHDAADVASEIADLCALALAQGPTSRAFAQFKPVAEGI